MRKKLGLYIFFLLCLLAPAATRADVDDENWDPQYYSPNIESILTMATLPGGELVCGGSFGSIAGVPSTTGLAKWDGARWSGFGAISLPGTVYTLVRDGTDLYVGGKFTLIGGVAATNLAKWDGVTWTQVGGGISGGVVRTIVIKDGELYVGGWFNRAGSINATNVAMWDGVQWNNLAGGMTPNGVASEALPPVKELFVHNNYVYAGGRFLTAGGITATNVARWNGTAWESLGTGPNNGVNSTVHAFCSDSSGNLVIGGEFTKAGTNSASLLVKWTGSEWIKFSQEVSRPSLGRVSSLINFGTDLYALGGFITAGTNSVRGFARWDGSQWHSVGAPVSEGGQRLFSSGGRLYVAAPLTSMNAKAAMGLVMFDGTNWKTFGSGFYGTTSSGSVLGLAETDGKLQAVGAITSRGAFNFAQWDGFSWSGATNGPSESFGQLQSYIYSVASDGHVGYVAGAFLLAGGQTANGVAQFSNNVWSTLGDGLPSVGLSTALRGNELFVGHTTGIVVWNGAEWVQLGTGIDGPVRYILPVGSGIYIGGSFTNPAIAGLRNIAYWDGTNWNAVGGGVDGTVYSLANYGSTIYAAGKFTNAGASICYRIAKFDQSSWQPLGEGLHNGLYDSGEVADPLTVVNALSILPTGTLIAAGNFTTAGTNTAKAIATWDGATWKNLGSGINVYPQCLLRQENSVLIGGYFTTAGTNSSSRLARYTFPEGFIDIVALGTNVTTSSNVTYTLRVKNCSPTSSGNVAVRAMLPLGAAFLSASNGGILVDDHVEWTVADLLSGSEVLLSFSVEVINNTRLLILSDYLCESANLGLSRGTRQVFTTVTFGNSPPSISIVETSSNLTLPLLSSLQLTFAASDVDDGIRQVDIFDGAKRLATLLSPPYSVVATNLRAGVHVFKAVAVNYAGVTASTNISVTVLRPPNDDFNNRLLLSGETIVTNGLNFDATTEPGEPNPMNSVWWRWTAPAKGKLRIRTTGTDFPHQVNVYSGSVLTNLTPVSSVWTLTSADFDMDVAGGTEYAIAIGGGGWWTEGFIDLQLNFDYAPTVVITSPANGANFGTAQNLAVNLSANDQNGVITLCELSASSFLVSTTTAAPYSFIVPIAGGNFTLLGKVVDNYGQRATSAPVTVNVTLANDYFANRVGLKGFEFVALGTTENATAEGGEPAGPRKSVWWKWKAPASGRVKISAESYEYAAAIEVFTGTSVGSLATIAASTGGFTYNEVTFEASAGVEYVICVDGFHFAAGTAAGRYKLTGKYLDLNSVRLQLLSNSADTTAFSLEGLTNMTFVLQYSTNLVNWSNQSTNILTNSPMQFTIPAGTSNVSFYRLRLEP